VAGGLIKEEEEEDVSHSHLEKFVSHQIYNESARNWDMENIWFEK
jgi:hypothetical protein